MFAKITLVLLIGCSTLLLSAQVSIGIKGGLAKSWRANIPGEDDDYVHKEGIQFSFVSFMRINNTLSLGIEPGYIPRITSATFFGFEDPGLVARVNVNYIALPIYISGRYPLWNDRLKMNVKAGYGISLLTGANREFQPGQLFTEPVIIKHAGWLNKVDHGFYSGIGIEYAMGRNKLILESDFYFGMRDVIVFDFSKNRTITTGIGYMLGF